MAWVVLVWVPRYSEHGPAAVPALDSISQSQFVQAISGNAEILVFLKMLGSLLVGFPTLKKTPLTKKSPENRPPSRRLGVVFLRPIFS